MTTQVSSCPFPLPCFILSPMKLTLRTLPHLIAFLIIGFILGAMAWELLERALSHSNIHLGLKLGPLSLVTGFLKMELFFTPGNVLGTAAGVSVFMGLK